MKKKIAITVLLVLLVVPASSEGFGVVPGNQDQKITGLETNISLGLLNLGDTTRNIVIEFKTSENFDVSPESTEIILEPSKVETAPGKGRWFSIGRGKYAEIRQVQAILSINSSSPVRNFSIPVTVTSNPVRGENIAETGQKVYQQRKTVFRVYTSSDGLETDKGVLYDGGELFRSNRSEKAQNQVENSSAKSTQEYREPEKGLTEETENSNRAINRWTALLLAGIAISLAMIWSEV